MNKSIITAGMLVAGFSLIASSMSFAAETDIKTGAKDLFIAHSIETKNDNGEAEKFIVLKHVKTEKSKAEAKKILEEKKADNANSSNTANSSDVGR